MSDKTSEPSSVETVSWGDAVGGLLGIGLVFVGLLAHELPDAFRIGSFLFGLILLGFNRGLRQEFGKIDHIGGYYVRRPKAVDVPAPSTVEEHLALADEATAAVHKKLSQGRRLSSAEYRAINFALEVAQTNYAAAAAKSAQAAETK